MQMPDYLTQFDSLEFEDFFLNIPYKKEFILSRIGQGKLVLDVGCLGGKLSKLIMDQSNQVWAVEINPQAAEMARTKGVRVQVANVEDGLPFENGFFDVVNAGDMISCLYDTTHFFLECYRVLRPGGVLLVSTSNINSLANRIKMGLGEYPSQVGAYPEDHFGEQVRVFNVQKIRELCDQTGFRIRDLRGAPMTRFSGLARVLGPLAKHTYRWVPRWSDLLLVEAVKPVDC